LIFAGKYGIDVVIVVRRYMARILLSYIFVCVIECTSYGYSGGSGMPDAPYLISTPEDWQMLCGSPNDVNAGNFFVLTNNLNLSGYAVTEVGNDSVPFLGSFDGGGHTIYGLAVTNLPYNYCGLFGQIAVGSYVHDLSVSAPSITSAPLAGQFMGGFAGYNEGTIRRCSVTGGTYTPSTPYMTGGFVGGNNGVIIDCSFTGDITVNGWYGGGFTAYNWGKLAYCSVQGNVTVYSNRGGLLAGGNSGGIYNSSAAGTVTTIGYNSAVTCGGLVGINSEIIDSSYANVTTHGYGSSKDNAWVGGLVGNNYASIVNSYATGNAIAHISIGTSVCKVGGLVGQNFSSVFRCYSTGQPLGGPTSQSTLGGLIGELISPGTANDSFWDVNTSGRSTSAAGVGLTTVQMKTISSFTSAGWDFTNESTNDINDNWRMCVNSVDYPRLSWQFSSTGDFACPADVDETDLAYLMNNWLTSSCPASYPCEMADLDHSGLVDFMDFALFAQNWTGSL
jgi:hypothetical protein